METAKKRKNIFARIFSVFTHKRVRNILYLLLIALATFSMFCIDKDNTIRKEYLSFLDNNFISDFMTFFGIERYNVTSRAWVWFIIIMTIALMIVLGNIIAPKFVAKKVKENPDLFSTEKRTRAFYFILFYGVLVLIAAIIVAIAYFAGAFYLYNGNTVETSPFISLLTMLAIFIGILAALFIAFIIVYFIIKVIVMAVTGQFRHKKEIAKPQQAEAPKKTAVVEPVSAPAPVVEPAPETVAAVVDAEPVINDIKMRKVYQKSFAGKLAQATKEQKEFYGEIKNYLLSFKRVNSRVSWHYDGFNVGRDKIVKISFRGQTMVAYFALNPKDYEKTKYHAHDMGEKRRFADTPAMIKIKSARGVKFAKELVDVVCAELGQKKNFVPETYKFPYMSDIKLVENGLAKELYIKVRNANK